MGVGCQDGRDLVGRSFMHKAHIYTSNGNLIDIQILGPLEDRKGPY